MKAADLIKFQSGYIATILDIKIDFDGHHHPYAVVCVHGDDVTFNNPTTMTVDMLQRTAEVIS